MTLESVEMWKVVCDEPGCATSTGYFDSEYEAWGDAGQAVDDWIDRSGRVSVDGRYWCPGHANQVCLECERVGDPDYIAEHDMCRDCFEAQS